MHALHHSEFAMGGHDVVLVKVLAAGFWGGCEGLQLSSCLHARGALCLCHYYYYYYLMCINHGSSCSDDAGLTAWLLPAQSQAQLHLLVPRLLQIEDLVPPSWAKHKFFCHWFPL